MTDLEQQLRKMITAGLEAAQRAADASKDVLDDMAKTGGKAFEQIKDSGADVISRVKKMVDESDINLTIGKKADKLRRMAREYAQLTPQERELVDELYEGLKEAGEEALPPRPEFSLAHNNINVIDLEKSLAFYRDALGLTQVRRTDRDDFTIVFLGDGHSEHKLELTWLRGWEKPAYNLGDNEFHLAFVTDDYDGAHRLHEKMGVICYENKEMGLYFIADPDGYWLEILPRK